MSNPLQIIGVSPVTLVASLDTSGNLWLRHDNDPLENYGDAIEVINDNLPVTIEILDFVEGSTTWQMYASHVVGQDTISWTRNSSSCCLAWSTTVGEVEVEARAGTQTAAKPILIKVRPRTEQ